MKGLTLTCLFACAIAEVEINEDQDVTISQKLMAALMRKRGPDIVRPKRHVGESVDVRFKMELYQVIELVSLDMTFNGLQHHLPQGLRLKRVYPFLRTLAPSGMQKTYSISY
ncbi:unnamed protein product [Strongylus vulgaris]|uniref:Uncharacterized protein n=1 Tax=Strongylus vulgaris TaxID=40348 RepID=A0A3P7IR40_STRVU|nr:unnamed protein product [Strongylus vulgaris]